jgi:hypothetical protein
LQAARTRNVPIEIVEWPGGEPTLFNLNVPEGEFERVLHGSKSIVLGNRVRLSRYGQVPWGSIVNVRCNGDTVPVATGPARCSKGRWFLPVPWQSADSNKSVADLQRRVPMLRRDKGYEPRLVKARKGSSGSTTPGLYERCVYTIAHLDKLKQAVHKRKGRDTFEERRRWMTGLKLLRAVKHAPLEVPILFGDANKCSRLVYWGVLRNISFRKKRTTYTFENLQRIPRGHKTQELWLSKQNRKIAPRFIRPYAICRTPEFLQRH